MGVIGCRDGNHVDLVTEGGQHFPVVLEKPGTLVPGKPRIGLAAVAVHVTEANSLDPLVLNQFAGIHTALAAGADMGGANTAIG